MVSDTAQELTIDELSRRSGVTVRNIRAHQSRGLLAPPVVRARTGYYGPDHVERLDLIRELQAEGFNLKAIERLLERTGDSGREVLGFTRSVLSPFASEPPEHLDRGELQRRLGTDDADVLARAEELRLVVATGEGAYEVPSPALLRAGEEVIALGVPIDHALAVLEQVTSSSQTIADAFIALCRDDVLAQIESDHDPDGWARAAAAVERLRPLASDALLATFQQVMTQAVEKALGDELAKRSGGR